MSMLSSLLNLRLAGAAAADSLTAGQDMRSLVCLFLHGGNDSFNMVVPRDDGYADYQISRSNLALPSQDLLPLDVVESQPGRSFGLHPSMPDIQELFNGVESDPASRRLSFIANVGTLLQPITMGEFRADAPFVPRALFSHNDQAEQWQTSMPQAPRQLSGWAGRAADLMHSVYNGGKGFMSVSVGGNNMWQVGTQTPQFVIPPVGTLGFSGPSDGSDPTNPLWIKNRTMKSLMEQTYTNLLQDAITSTSRASAEAQADFRTALGALGDLSGVAQLFPKNNDLSDRLLAIVRAIAVQRKLGLRRQTFFVSWGGWDHHFEGWETHRAMLSQLSAAVGAYQRALEVLGLVDSVITFTASDFGRTLRSNSRGTDHAWGGNQMVFGGPVRGGRIIGKFPSLALNGPDDVGLGGRMLPTTSVDVFFCELLRWFGVSPGSMSVVLPNIRSFYDPNSATDPLGFRNPLA